MKIKVIIKRPDEEVGHVTNISQSLKNLQNTVGGYIETVSLPDGVVIICNEEGRILGLPHNCIAYGVDFVGTIIVCGRSGDAFADIPISLAEWKGILAQGGGWSNYLKKEEEHANHNRM